MIFTCPEIEGLNPEHPNDIVRLIEKLCGQKIATSTRQLERLQQGVNSVPYLDYEQFNEILLLLNRDRIQEHFFNYFFSAEKTDSPGRQLREGVTKFCGLAMLLYGNFRFAYKELNDLRPERFRQKISEYDPDQGEERLRKIGERRSSTLQLEPIQRNNTWFTGYLSTGLLEKDKQTLYAISYKLGVTTEQEIRQKIQDEKTDKAEKIVANIFQKSSTVDTSQWRPHIADIQTQLEEFDNTLQDTRRKAEENTHTYLNWEYMDIYFATSMRHPWEFHAAWDFVNAVFAENGLKGIGLRYFDPTQSFMPNRVNKGLVEGLMLKRASITVYLAQETDTLGKDSELASTLAQGKPVIAYVPSVGEKYWDELPSQPVDFFWKRSLLLHAEDAFKEEDCDKELSEKLGNNWIDKLEKHLDTVSQYLKQRTFYLVGDEDVEFKSRNEKMFSELCTMLGTAEKHYLDKKRAETLGKRHPLSIQVNLRTGVANGVLVVRDAPTCANLIEEILSNKVHFSIVKEQGVTELREKHTQCPYRVVTDDETLTNSFWNFYLTESTPER